MKKVMVIMTMVIMVIVSAVSAVAEDLMPAIHMNNLDCCVYDGYDFDVGMYLRLPEYENAYVNMQIRFTEDEEHFYNEGVAYLYDANTGELIDSTDGWINIDCSSKDPKTVQENMYNFLMTYDYETDDSKYGVRYFSIWF